MRQNVESSTLPRRRPRPPALQARSSYINNDVRDHCEGIAHPGTGHTAEHSLPVEDPECTLTSLVRWQGEAVSLSGSSSETPKARRRAGLRLPVEGGSRLGVLGLISTLMSIMIVGHGEVAVQMQNTTNNCDTLAHSGSRDPCQCARARRRIGRVNYTLLP